MALKGTTCSNVVPTFQVPTYKLAKAISNESLVGFLSYHCIAAKSMRAGGWEGIGIIMSIH